MIFISELGRNVFVLGSIRILDIFLSTRICIRILFKIIHFNEYNMNTQWILLIGKSYLWKLCRFISKILILKKTVLIHCWELLKSAGSHNYLNQERNLKLPAM